MKPGDRVTLSQIAVRAGVLRLRQKKSGRVTGEVVRVNESQGTVSVKVDGLKMVHAYASHYWEAE